MADEAKDYVVAATLPTMKLRLQTQAKHLRIRSYALREAYTTLGVAIRAGIDGDWANNNDLRLRVCGSSAAGLGVVKYDGGAHHATIAGDGGTHVLHCDLDVDVLILDRNDSPFRDNEGFLPNEPEPFFLRVRAIYQMLCDQWATNDAVTITTAAKDVNRKFEVQVTVQIPPEEREHYDNCAAVVVEADVFPKRWRTNGAGDGIGVVGYGGGPRFPAEFDYNVTEPAEPDWYNDDSTPTWEQTAILTVKHYVKANNLQVKSYHISALARRLKFNNGVKDVFMLWSMLCANLHANLPFFLHGEDAMGTQYEGHPPLATDDLPAMLAKCPRELKPLHW